MFNNLFTHELERAFQAQQERIQRNVRPFGFRQPPVTEAARPPAAELLVPEGWLGLLLRNGRPIQRFPAGPHRFQAEGLCEVRLMPAGAVGDPELGCGRTLWFAGNGLLCIEQSGANVMAALSKEASTQPRRNPSARVPFQSDWQEEDTLDEFSFI